MSQLCPACGGKAEQVHRRTIDRALSTLIPLKRFRCTGRECSWEGNLTSDEGEKRAKLITWVLVFLSMILVARIITSMG